MNFFSLLKIQVILPVWRSNFLAEKVFSGKMYGLGFIYAVRILAEKAFSRKMYGLGCFLL